MSLSKKSKKRVIYFFSIIFLVCMIIVFIGTLIIAFEIDLEDLLSGKQELKITVENKSSKTKDVRCYLLKTKKEGDISDIFDMDGRYLSYNDTETFIFKYTNPNEIRRVRIVVYNFSEGLEENISCNYDFPENKIYGLESIIEKNGSEIKIIKAT